MTEIPEYFKNEIYFDLLRLSRNLKCCPFSQLFVPIFFVSVHVIIQAQKRSLFWAESSRHTSRSYILLVRKSRAEAEGLSPLHGVLSCCNGKVKPPTNQPTNNNKKKNTRHLSNNNNQTSAHIFYPKPSFILELVVVVRSFFIYLFFVVVVLVILSKQTPRGFLLSDSTRRTKRNHQRMVDGET